LTSVSCASPTNLTASPPLKNEERLAGQRNSLGEADVSRLRKSLWHSG
jgi:hypothetical protein